MEFNKTNTEAIENIEQQSKNNAVNTREPFDEAAANEKLMNMWSSPKNKELSSNDVGDPKEDNQDRQKRFEDYSSEEIDEMARTDPERAIALNIDYQERVSADKLGMTVEEYRDHLQRIADVNKDKGDKDTLSEEAQSTSDELQIQQESIYIVESVDNDNFLSEKPGFETTSMEVSEQLTNETECFKGWSDYNSKCLEIGRDESLSKDEKVTEIQKTYYATDDKTDICPPSDAQYVKAFDETGNIEYEWPDNLGFEPGTERSVSRDDPPKSTWDRYGHIGGSNFSPIPESGPYTMQERSIPYIQNPDAYHHGSFNVDSYFDKIDAIRNIDIESLNNILKSEGYATVSNDYFENLTERYYDFQEDAKTYFGDNVDAMYGLKGDVAPWRELEGGAEQLTTPLSGIQMKRLGIINEEE